ncbi:MAG: hypothetical protein E3K37_03460 [Candidatus Kuenenia sp.]|nr:hypothetical protein [Candidatus Kuenenia hertensis]
MKKYTITIKLLSDALIHSGEGFGAIIDSDIVFDDIGIPYIPAKRIKGCLRDAAKEACEMLESAQADWKGAKIEDAFGKAGNMDSAPVYFSNLTINEYENNRQWFEYLREAYTREYTDTGKKYWTGILSRESVLSTFTHIRQQTSIAEDGVADKHTLRTIRVLKKGIIFHGEIHVVKHESTIKNLLALACLNLRHIGTKRNRGFGEVECKLYDGDTEVSILHELEAICIN